MFKCKQPTIVNLYTNNYIFQLLALLSSFPVFKQTIPTQTDLIVIRFLWAPSDVCIVGNEKEDSLTKGPVLTLAAPPPHLQDTRIRLQATILKDDIKCMGGEMEATHFLGQMVQRSVARDPSLFLVYVFGAFKTADNFLLQVKVSSLSLTCSCVLAWLMLFPPSSCR